MVLAELIKTMETESRGHQRSVLANALLKKRRSDEAARKEHESAVMIQKAERRRQAMRMVFKIRKFWTVRQREEQAPPDRTEPTLASSVNSELRCELTWRSSPGQPGAC
jgi:hypothetical protein